MTSHHPEFDVERITECLARHGVEYLLVGGFGAQLHGATRPTGDIDALAAWSDDNLERTVAALRELNARLRVHGMSDEEAAALPSMLFTETLRQMEISTWRTDVGDLDIMADLRAVDGGRRRYEELASRASQADIGGIVVSVAALEDIIEAKTFADRDKDREALPELRRLLEEYPASDR